MAEEWNATEVHYPGEKLIHKLFEEQAQRSPDAVALVYEEQSLTYGELDGRANLLAWRLRGMGVGPESCVGLYCRRSAEMVIGMLGILKAGAAYAPLEPTYPQERLAFIIASAALRALLTDRDLAPSLPTCEAQIIFLADDWPKCESPVENDYWIESGVTPNSLAYVIYTSGSTGQPKGVMISHRAICNRVLWTLHAFPMGPQDCLFQKTPYSFDASVWEIFAPLLSGARLLVARPEGHRDSAYLCEMIVERQVTVLQLVPSMLRVFLREREVERCASLVHVFCGGEELRGEDQELFRRRLGARLHNLYGPTEVSIDATHLECEDLEPVTIGRPLSNVKVYILDSRLTPAPMGVPGELHVGGVGLARGYLNRPDLSGEKFIPDPHGGEAGARLYKTGDQGRWMPDGTIEYLGRNDSQVKIRGFRIELGEIEAALGQHPSIGEAVVLAREDRPDDRRLVAYVVPKHGRAGAINGPPGEDNFRKSDQIELWPCVGEYQVYDELLYYAMTKDERRNNSYKAAIDRLVKDKVVLDLGAGKDVIWARYCVEAGARRVYAVEILDEVCEQAEAYIKSLGLQEKIVLIRGDSTKTQLPEKVDVCVSNVIGTIGSSEGVVPILNDARRFLREDGVMIPQRVVTKIAAVCLPEELQNNLGFPEVAAYYAEKVFNQAGGKFDLRLCLRNFPGSNVISEAAVFEDLEFKSRIEPEYQREVRVTLNRNSRFDGFLLWLNIQTIEGEIIDNFEQEYSWLPVYVPVFYPGVEASVGDRIEAVCSVAMSDNGLNPDYRIEGSLIRKTGEAVNFRHDSFHHKISYKKTPFYQTLFAGDTIRVIDTGGRAGLTNGSLRAYLQRSLPAHTIPSAFVTLDALPLTPNGKVDRRALPAPDLRGVNDRDGYMAPRTLVEEIVVGIFEEVLKLGRVGKKDNFFEMGGHSLLAVQVISRVRNGFGVEIGVRSIFDAPTVEALSRKIEEAMKAGEKVEAPPLVRIERAADRVGRFPLSFAQQRLWFIDQLNPGSPLYNNPGMDKIEGALNLKAFERVINEIVRRHETLRTRFEVYEGEPAQVIDEWESRRLEVADLTNLSPEEKEEEVNRMAREEVEAGFDLSQGPLLRVKVLKLEVDEHIVLYTMHHIVSDAWSMEILIREVKALYQVYLVGGASPLPELPIQYADFAVWQREWLKGEALEEKLKYWRRQLEGIEDLALPTDHPRPATRSYRGGSRYFVVGSELTRKLRELSQREGATLFMAMLGGFDILMSRYSGQEDVVVGTDTASRNRSEIEGLVGFFVNQLVMRVEVKTEENFKGLLKRVRGVCLAAYAHEDAPFEKLVEELRPERDLSRSPLFQTKLIWQNAPGGKLGIGSLSRLNNGGGEVQMASEAQMARFDLLVSIVDINGDLVGTIDYSRELFEAETIERLMRHYMNLLREIADGSERPISALNLLSGAEREQIVVEWNRTERPYMNDRPIHELFAEQAERTPERIALVGGGKRVSYRELNRRANQLGNYLQRLGVGPEVVVGVCLDRSVEMIVAILGVLKAGGAYLPLDPEFPAERLALLLEDAGVRLVLTRQSLEGRLRAFGRQTVLIAEEWERISGESEDGRKREPESVCEAENLAYVIYTSGSTGKPKGVMVRHRSLVNYSQDICRRLGLAEGPEDDGLQFATVSTITADLGNTCIYPSLLSGGCLHVLSYETAIDGERFEEYLRHEPIDALKIVPSHMNALLSSRPNGVRMLPQKYLILGGEALSYGLVERVRSRGEGCEVINHYGPTETTIGSLTARVGDADLETRRSMTAPIGTPIANTRSYILGRDMNPVPVGGRGELQISGEGVARGYLGRPDLTAERFIPNPFEQNGGERVYRTGDVVRYLSDSKIEFLGRADDQVKVRGYRVELGEIQAVLNGRRGVRQSVVVVNEDQKGDKQIVGYVVTEGEVTVAELKQYARERLPEYMTPETIVLLEEIPITANGKLDRKRLPALSDAMQPEEESFIQARDVFEYRLVKIWESVLEIRPIGVRDSFFDLGGHSILAAILMARIHSEFGRELPLYLLFQERTIERLATFLKQEASSMSWSCLVELQASGSKPPLFFVHPGGGNVHSYYDLARCLGSDRPFYAFQQPGLYKEQSLFTSIEDLAAYYIEAMKTAQPEGPYFIGGWSFGGIVAFEMARQLFAQDQKVGKLLLLDSGAPISMKKYLGEEYEGSEEDEDENKDDAALLIDLLAGLRLSEEDLKPFEGDKRIEYVLKRGIDMNFFPPDVDLARARTYLELFRTNARARRKYLPPVYQGSVTLFRPFTQLALPPSDGSERNERVAKLIHDNGWSELAAGGVRVIEVPGDHVTMVGDPHVETLALRIRERLDEAENIEA